MHGGGGQAAALADDLMAIISFFSLPNFDTIKLQ